MAWNGSGTYTQTDGTYSGSDICASQAGDGTATIQAAELDALFEDHAAAINACLAKNGENALTGNLSVGGFRLTGLGTPSASTDAALHGDVIASGAYSAGDSEIQLTQNDGTRIDIDVSSLEAGTGGVDTTTAQSIGGVKTFTANTSLAYAKLNGATVSKLAVPTPGSSVTIDATAANDHYVTVGTNTNVTFTWPTGSDTQIGANWSVKGEITFRHTSAGHTITLNSTMLAALDYYEEEGSHADGSGDLSTLTYNYKYVNGTKICQFAWVATPAS